MYKIGFNLTRVPFSRIGITSPSKNPLSPHFFQRRLPSKPHSCFTFQSRSLSSALQEVPSSSRSGVNFCPQALLRKTNLTPPLAHPPIAEPNSKSSSLTPQIVFTLSYENPELLSNIVNSMEPKSFERVFKELVTSAANTSKPTFSSHLTTQFLLQHFSKIKNVDPSCLIDLASLTLCNIPSKLSSLGITEPQILEKVALKVAKLSPHSLLRQVAPSSLVIHHLEIRSQDSLETILFQMIDSLELGEVNGNSRMDSLSTLITILPILSTRKEFLEEAALRLSYKGSPFFLRYVALKVFPIQNEELLKKLVLNTIHGRLKDSSYHFTSFIRTLTRLGIQDVDFLEKACLDVLRSSKNPNLVREILTHFKNPSLLFLKRLSQILQIWNFKKDIPFHLSLNFSFTENIYKHLILFLIHLDPHFFIDFFPKLAITDVRYKKAVLFTLLQATHFADFSEDGQDNHTKTNLLIQRFALKEVSIRKNLIEEFLEHFPLSLDRCYFLLDKTPIHQEWLSSYLLQKNPSLFFHYFKTLIHLEKEQVLSVLTKYGKWLHQEKNYLLSEEIFEKVFSKILHYTDQPLSDFLVKNFSEGVFYPSYQTFYKEFTFLKQENQAMSIHRILPSIIPCKWVHLLEKNDSLDPEIQKAKDTFLEFLQHPKIRQAFRNPTHPSFLHSYLLAVTSLEKDPSLSHKDKLLLLARFCDISSDPTLTDKEIAKRLNLLYVLCEQNLGNTLALDPHQDLLEQLCFHTNEVFLRNSYADLEGIHNLGQKYLKTFSRTRIPGSLAAYQIGLTQLADPNIRKDFSWFVRSVLEETAQKERYRTDINPNLERLSHFPEAFQKWQEPLPAKIIPGDQQKDLIVKDIDDVLTLFELPSLVAPSCLKVTGSPYFNIGLLSYCMDGCIRMITIEDKEGHFLARSLLRVVLDEHQKPALLLEPLYKDQKIAEEIAKKAIAEMALQKASYLNLSLYTKTDDTANTSKDSFVWLGSSCTVSYSDCLGGILYNQETKFSFLNLIKIK